ncbi:hypothetical protein NHX12_006295 [Muraenolepis orangiensis]|uniref:Uncharacterized protein n=1 Tax=Muraenolepis orangiensis TaxID=630683 RepID=A0A9Q0DT83_9TELE|nr:hypothetical protein NHX12_006295 [Muraenolepis orangiensis]
MGDIEAPPAADGPTGSRTSSVLMSILPTKEFALSRKGMLLISEVVRKEKIVLGRGTLIVLGESGRIPPSPRLLTITL